MFIFLQARFLQQRDPATSNPGVLGVPGAAGQARGGPGDSDDSRIHGGRPQAGPRDRERACHLWRCVCVKEIRTHSRVRGRAVIFGGVFVSSESARIHE